MSPTRSQQTTTPPTSDPSGGLPIGTATITESDGGTPDLQTEKGRLSETVVRLQKQGWANSTSETYSTHYKTYRTFCDVYKVESVPADTTTIEHYIAYLVDVKHLKFNSVKCYLNIVSILHKSAGLPDPIASSWAVQHLLKGVKRELGTAQSCKTALSPHVLLKMHNALDFSYQNNRVFWAACLTGFFGFLRPNNFLVKGAFNPSVHVQYIDLLQYPWGFLLSLKLVKTLQFRQHPIDIVLPKLDSHPLCPCRAIRNALVSGQDPLGPLFVLSSGSCLTYSVFLRALRVVLSDIGFDQSSFGGHSFRRGAAT
ncbi:uncharacterized protein LOC117327812 [Pecten maximus]|uniref:uncharacterized protein LOC117327812 n=1 Tax=Pecten maximus TaxID=6579 RepID=UPI001457E953|nr:uncharacterized protein LOC117327812 [Pecten maximus]